MGRREYLTMMDDFLGFVKRGEGKESKSAIMKRTKMNCIQLKKYLTDAKRFGFVLENRYARLELMGKGEEYRRRYRDLVELLK